MAPTQTIQINRAPVLTLWAAVVAERLGHDREAALTLGKAVAGLNAQAKGRRLGIFKPSEKPERPAKRGPGEQFWVHLLGRAVPATQTPDGVRAVAGDKPTSAASVQSYLERSFGDDLAKARDAMTALANSYKPDELSVASYGLYEQFRPNIPAGKEGMGCQGRAGSGVDRLASSEITTSLQLRQPRLEVGLLLLRVGLHVTDAGCAWIRAEKARSGRFAR